MLTLAVAGYAHGLVRFIVILSKTYAAQVLLGEILAIRRNVSSSEGSEGETSAQHCLALSQS
jgi:hypothetical protein